MQQSASDAARDGSGLPDLAAGLQLANRVLVYHLGSEARLLEHQGSGITNIVFRAEHAQGEFVVRLCDDPARLDDFLKERWAIERARAAGVPTPEVLEVGAEPIDCPYMLMHRVHGQEASAHPNRMGILGELGRYAALINAIPTHGFGTVFDWAPPGRPIHSTWRGFLERELRLDARLGLLERHEMLSAGSGEVIRGALEALGERPSRLNHGDLRLKNAIVDEDGRIKAILDWEKAIAGPAPEWELSLALHDLSVDEKEAFTAGYGMGPDELERIASALKALNVVNYAPFIEEAASAGDREQLDRYRARLTGVLDLFSI